MGGCLQSNINNKNRITQTTKNDDQVKKLKQPQSYIVSPDNFARFFSMRHIGYLQRKYISICSSTSQNLSLKNMIQLFSYLNFSNETMNNLYSLFKKDRNYLDYQTFRDQCQNLISCSNDELSNYIYRLYFAQNNSGTILSNKFQAEFKHFFSNIKIKQNQLQQNNLLNQKLKQLTQILDNRKQGKSKIQDKKTCKWIIQNIDLKRFRLFFLQWGLQIDQKQAYTALIQDQRNLLVNGEIIVIYKKWCQIMGQYIKQKYKIKQVRQITNSRLTEYHSGSKINKKSGIQRLISLGGGYDQQIFQLPKSAIPSFVDQYDLSFYPGMINNQPLSGNFDWEIKQNIKQAQYIKVRPQTFQKLWICYGGGPKFLRHLYKGYLDLKPYFIKIYKFQYYKEQNKAYLTCQTLQMVSSKQKIKQLIPNIVNKYIAYHRNIGQSWQQFPFQESQQIVQQVFSTTSFLVYMTMNFKKQFNKFYITRQNQKDIPIIGDTYQYLKEKDRKYIVCIRQVEKIPSIKGTKQLQIIVKYVSLTQVHALRKKPLLQFLNQFKLYQNINMTLHKRKNLRAGIQNLGNTCYMNAALQNIIAVRNQDNIFREDKKISKQILIIIKQIQKRKKSIFPLQFKTAFDESFPYFKGNQQQDTHQFLVSLLTKLQEQNQSVIRRQFDTKITQYISCKSCKKVKQNIQSSRIISLPLRDYNKKQIKIDLIRKNKDITTYVFELDPNITIEQWIDIFKKAAKLQKFYICELTNSDISRTFIQNKKSQTIKSLKIESQDYLVAFELQQEYKICKQINLRKNFYVYIDQSDKKRIAKIQKVYSHMKSSKIQKVENVALIKYKNGDKFYSQNVHQTELKKYPPQNRIILIKVINYDSDYQQRIGIPFIIQMLAHYPLSCIRQWLQKTIGKQQYTLRIAPFGNTQVCASCNRKYCDRYQCFTDEQQNYPLQWYQNRVQFVVRWKNSFKYKQILKRQRFLAAQTQNTDPNSMDSFQTSFQLFQQPSELQMSCSFCQKANTIIESRQKVTTWPNILIFHLKRFRINEEGLVKIFTKWKLQKQFTFGKIKYSLKGIIVHLGTNIDSGHYIAVIDGYKYDNDVVKECSFDQVQPQQIYMLFYVRVE